MRMASHLLIPRKLRCPLKRRTHSGTAPSAAEPCALSNGFPRRNSCFAHHRNQTGAQLEPLSASSAFARASARTQVPCLICPETLGRLYLQPPPDASLQSFVAPPRLKSRRSCSD